MSNPLLVPLQGGPGGPPVPPGLPEHAHGFAPFFPIGGLMFFLFLLLLLGTLFYLVRSGRMNAPAWLAARSRTPEAEAKQILAERFARGDIASDEFMERASVLNWTPGVTPPRPPKKRFKKTR